MAIVGFNFEKIVAEKNEQVSGRINISNNVSVKNVEKTDLSLGKASQKGLKFEFVFTSSYEPKIGSIVLQGNVIFVDEEKKINEILSTWKKNKRVPNDIMRSLMNTILNKCNIEALILSRDINLPAPVPLPKVKVEGE